MSYLVLARKWRPQTFDQVVGQAHVTRTLENAIRLNRVAHAYLFTGARGVGKTSVARILAKAMNCERGPAPVPCNECSHCREITQGSFMDVLEIDGASNRGIDNIRELQETVRYRPIKGHYKIYIIDEVHMLTVEAFNALLKTLEEPPPHVLFVFATTEPHKIPATINSRCQRFDFRRIPSSVILEHLQKIVADERARLSELVLYAVAREADGSMRDAQSLLEQLLAFRGQDLNDEEILEILGVMDRRSVHQVGEAVLARDAKRCLQMVEAIYRRGVDSRRFCQQLCDYFRNLLLLSLQDPSDSVGIDLPSEEIERFRKSLQATTPEALHLLFQMTLKGEESIRTSTQPRLVLEMLLLRLCRLPELRTVEQLIQRVERLEPGTSAVAGDEAPSPEPATPVPSEPESVAAVEPVPAPAPEPVSLREPEPVFDEEMALGPPLSRELEPEALAAPAAVDDEVAAADGCARQEAGEPGKVAALPADAEVVSRWDEFLNWLRLRDEVLAAKLEKSRLSEGAEGGYTVGVLELYLGVLANGDASAKLNRYFAEFFKIDCELRIRGAESKADKARPGSKPGRRRRTPQKLVLEHPAVQQALDILGGELLEIRRRK